MKSNEIWHIDTSVVRLLDGSKAYLHAVIDNYSRRILSWKVSSTFNPVATAEILLTASKGMADCKPRLLVDGGVENFNGAVDELVETGLLNRVLAQTETTFSNSMIESWWRVLKHLRPCGRRHARNGSRPIGSERVAHVRGRLRSQAESECPVSGG